MIKIVQTIFLFLIFSFLFIDSAFSQQEAYLAFAEVMPQPVGGITSIYKHIVYPETAREAHLEGKVYLLVYISEEGKVDNVTIIKGLGLGCDKAAVDAVKSENFTPGEHNGKKVKVKLAIPISFQLDH